MKVTGNMFNVIAGHKLLKLIGVVRWTIVSHKLVRNSMSREMYLEGMKEFACGHGFEEIDLKVA